MPRKRTKAEKEVKVAPAAATTPKPASKLTAKPCDFLSTVTGDWMSLWNSTGDTALPRGWGFDRQLAQELVFSVTTAGSLLITGTVSASLTVVDTRTWEIVKELEMEDEESGVVYALSVTHDGQLVVGTEDGYITVWSMKSWECQYGIPAHREAVLCLAQVAANRVASGSADGSIVVWSSDAWESQQTLHGHEGEVAVLEAARGCLFSAGDDCVVRVWSVDHSGWWECESVLSGGHQKPIVSAAMLKESQLVTCDQAAGVAIWDLEALELSISMEKHTGPVWALPLGDGVMVNGNTQGEMKVWRFASLEDQVERLAVEVSSEAPERRSGRSVFNLDGDVVVGGASDRES